jgi:transposase
MGYIEGHSRDQMLLLPASVDDYVAADNPVRFIAAFVDDLDLGELGFGRSRPKATGRPGYDPADLLKLYLYGYLNRVRSSRCLAAETARNLEVIWLLGGLRPDFRTMRISVAPTGHHSGGCSGPSCCCAAALTCSGGNWWRWTARGQPVNSRKRNFTRQKLAGWIKQADERVGEYLARLDRADHAEAEAEGAARRAAVLRQRSRGCGNGANGTARCWPISSPAAKADVAHRSRCARHGDPIQVGVGYNSQVAVDARHELIVEQYLTNLRVSISPSAW